MAVSSLPQFAVQDACLHLDTVAVFPIGEDGQTLTA
jgi:hypothetical protein